MPDSEMMYIANFVGKCEVFRFNLKLILSKDSLVNCKGIDNIPGFFTLNKGMMSTELVSPEMP